MPATTVARLVCDQRTARRLADTLSESLDDAVCAAFEDARGQWQVAIHFVGAPDAAALRALARAADAATAAAFTLEQVDAADWVAQSLAGLQPVRAGRFLVHGAHDRARVPANAIGIEIEAALAFGTGHHGTTRGCLLALDALAKRSLIPPLKGEGRSRPARSGWGHCKIAQHPHPARSARHPPPYRGRDKKVPLPFQGRDKKVLDVGTGTGVLAIAAARALRRRVIASDIDPRAAAAARGNARLNRAAPLVTVLCAAGVNVHAITRHKPYDLIFANILLGPLMRLAVPLARLTRPGAHVVLSGLLPAQANAVLAVYRAQGLALARRIVLEGWVTLLLKR